MFPINDGMLETDKKFWFNKDPIILNSLPGFKTSGIFNPNSSLPLDVIFILPSYILGKSVFVETSIIRFWLVCKFDIDV